jgi:hypothetical protein
MRALTGDTELFGDMSDRTTPQNTGDQQPPATRGQTSVSVGHEDLRDVATSNISTKPGGPPSHQEPDTNVMAGYT